MQNQSNIQELLKMLQVALDTNASMPWELSDTSSTAGNRGATVNHPSSLARTAASNGNDYGVGLPPMAG